MPRDPGLRDDLLEPLLVGPHRALVVLVDVDGHVGDVGDGGNLIDGHQRQAGPSSGADPVRLIQGRPRGLGKSVAARRCPKVFVMGTIVAAGTAFVRDASA